MNVECYKYFTLLFTYVNTKVKEDVKKYSP